MFEFDKAKCISPLLIVSFFLNMAELSNVRPFDAIHARAKHVGFGKLEENRRFLNIQRQKLE